MDISAIAAQLAGFLQTDFGRIIGQIAGFLYNIFSPSNAPGAHDVPLPNPATPKH